eukprot:6186698-Pleurochrysis_carterae.AAC.2
MLFRYTLKEVGMQSQRGFDALSAEFRIQIRFKRNKEMCACEHQLQNASQTRRRKGRGRGDEGESRACRRRVRERGRLLPEL